MQCLAAACMRVYPKACNYTDKQSCGYGARHSYKIKVSSRGPLHGAVVNRGV